MSMFIYFSLWFTVLSPLSQVIWLILMICLLFKTCRSRSYDHSCTDGVHSLWFHQFHDSHVCLVQSPVIFSDHLLWFSSENHFMKYIYDQFYHFHKSRYMCILISFSSSMPEYICMIWYDLISKWLFSSSMLGYIPIRPV